jgi:hypothetical protein
VLAPCFRHARVAMGAPALQDRQAADRACDWIGWARFDGWQLAYLVKLNIPRMLVAR